MTYQPVWRRSNSRVLVNHESLCEADDAQAVRVVPAMGRRRHVLTTLRGYAALLRSAWQESVKSGTRLGYAAWLRMVLAEPSDPRISLRFPRRTDQAATATARVRRLGPDQVTATAANRGVR